MTGFVQMQTKTSKKPVPFVNKIVDKGELRRLLSRIYFEHGAAKTAALANSLKDLGFKFATRAGITISIEDLVVPEQKKNLLADAEAQIERSNQRFLRGDITEVERYTKVIDTWSETTEKLTTLVVDSFDRMNPVYMMAFSGARGNISQVRQLVGMRGLMADAQGQIIDLPIKTNFREGLSVTEYIISSYGARKGLVDTALKTADSGYLTRRLVDVAQDVIIQEEDCGTTRGILMEPILEGDTVVVKLGDRLVSRSAAVDVVDSQGNLLVKAGQLIDQELADAIDKSDVKSVLIRTALMCESGFGICQTCYGWSLTTNKPVDIGEAIGIMAAQSIGEPGTQLTMRTFHTGGVFSGGTTRDTTVAKSAGKLKADLPARESRTRHGDVVQITTRDTEMVVEKANGKTDVYNLPINATVFVSKAGDVVTEGMLLADFESGGGRDGRRLTERATKDLNASQSGEIHFESFEADEKRDRQGNITRTASRNGTVWVLSGDVYNLPAGAKHLVVDAQEVKEGDVIAETLVATEHGGQVRIPEDLQTELSTIAGETVNKVVNGKELTVVIASIQPDNAELKPTKKEQVWVCGEEQHIIKSLAGTVVENGSIIAELIDDTQMLPTSGEIRYDDVEVDEQRILTKPGRVYFIPEEIHQVSKDSSLKNPKIESGMFIAAGTEVVKDVVTRIDGIVEIIEDNDIIHEVIVRPGELHKLDDVSLLSVEDRAIVDAGTEVAPGIVAKDRSMVTVQFKMADPAEDETFDEDADTSDYEYAEILLRPVQEFDVKPREVGIRFNTNVPDLIELVPVTQLQFRDGDKVRNIEGSPLCRTSMVLQMKGYLSRLKGQVEMDATDPERSKLKIVVLENLIIRRETAAEVGRSTTQTQLLVKDGDVIDKKTPVVKTQVLVRTSGRISLGNAHSEKEIRRVLLVTPAHEVVVPVTGKPSVSMGEYVRAEQVICDGGTATTISGHVLAVSNKSLTLRTGRPYLISAGAQLQVENRSLAQRGDLIASLVFERQKTGDIVQGLPRVEELLEGRKPKDSAIIAGYDATVELTYEEEQPRLYLVSADSGREEISLPLGANILVDDKQPVTSGQPLTDGPINPHDLLMINGVGAVRKYLVDEVQRVYRSQGVEIADKHIEVIVRQMTKKVRVADGGDTVLLSGELLDERSVHDLNAKLKELGASEYYATFEPVLLGITKASLNTDSFISAASFQETTRVLTEAAVEGKKDYLRGLKENVIIGRLIPAGTGFPKFKDERIDMMDDSPSVSSRSNARKPSAILEEIESMFGAPDISGMSPTALMEDDEALASLSVSAVGVDDDEEDFEDEEV
jgi:DNA-directed RNA polymerase subunit beta'